MKSQHTPGPWFTDHLVEPEHMAKCLVENPTWIAIEDTADDGGHVAYCAPENGPLIAAAPELLFALENLLAVKYGEGGTVFDSDEIARAAIAKAKGESK